MSRSTIDGTKKGAGMTNVELTLPDSVKQFLDTESAAKGYASLSEYMTALLLDIQERRAFWSQLEPAVLEGLASPVQEMTAEDWDDLYAEVEGVHPEREAS